MIPAGFSERARWPWLIEGVLVPLLPRRCPVCGTTISDRERSWCAACEAGMRVYDQPVCVECRRFLANPGATCPAGHDGAEPAIIRALGAFDSAFGIMAHALKYDGFRGLARSLGGLLAERLADVPVDLVVPIPTAPHKRRKRGFGHAEELAEACAANLGLVCGADTLRFTRRVADQTRLNAAQRRANLHGALAVRADRSLDGARVLIVDDVLTTGATMREAARALKAVGAAHLLGAVVALNLNAQR